MQALDPIDVFPDRIARWLDVAAGLGPPARARSIKL